MIRSLARRSALLGTVAVVSVATLPALALAQVADSAPQSEGSARPPAEQQRRPNFVVWMIDDAGFSQLGCYGGVIDTPNLDKLAQSGLRYTNFHTTPVCASTRAAFLTGRMPHAVDMGNHAAAALPFPGYRGQIPANAGTVAENLRQSGYQTYAVGKWDHLRLTETSAGGPYTSWPSNQGFDRFYGFLAAETDNFKPQLWSDHAPAAPDQSAGYHLTTDLVDHAISFIEARNAVGERPPFFLYFATGAIHAPHHAPDAYLARYRGKFDAGWDAVREQILARQKAQGIVPANTTLADRPEGMPAWNTLSADQKKVYARAMEAAAAQLTHADAEFGRLLAELKHAGELENTVVIVLSDNGASAEGSPEGAYSHGLVPKGQFPTLADNLPHVADWGTHKTSPHYPLGWAVAGNTPFRYYKNTPYEGGTRVPLIMAWGSGLKAPGQLRGQYSFVADLAPTILEMAGVRPARYVNNTEQSPMQGTSMTYTFTGASVPTARPLQYYEINGSRAIWRDGWKAVSEHNVETWKFSKSKPFEKDNWQLYNLDAELNEMTDLSSARPEILSSLKTAFDGEAAKYNIYPLHEGADGMAEVMKRTRAAFMQRRGYWSYPEPIERVSPTNAPPIARVPFTMTAQAQVNSDRATGPVFVVGGEHGGISLGLREGRMVFSYRATDLSLTETVSQSRVPAGKHELSLTIRPSEGKQHIELAMDGSVIGMGEYAGQFDASFPMNEYFSIGFQPGSGPSPLSRQYARFPGTLSDINFDFRGAMAAKPR
ncbi:MAG: arylsulfatase [Novosphingobium sp.]|nr:arylsulfatase [Novosphingobium sp.]